MSFKYYKLGFYLLLCACLLQHASAQEEEENAAELKSESENATESEDSDDEFHPIHGIFNTFANLTQLAKREETIYALAVERLRNLELEVRKLKEYIEDYKETTGNLAALKEANDNPVSELVASSGIASYRMIHRFTTHLQQLKIIYEDEANTDFQEVLLDEDEEVAWPSIYDLNHVMQSFVHVMEIHDFHLEMLPMILSHDGETAPVDLKAIHYAQIGMYALYKDYFSIGFEFLEHANGKSKDASISLPMITNSLQVAMKMHNEAREELPTYVNNVFYKDVTLEQDPRERTKRRDIQLENYKGLRGSEYVEVNFWALCGGQNLQNEAEKSTLFCYYDAKSQWAWLINPLKIEQLSKSPEVLQIYDVLGDAAIKEILAKSENKLKRSGTVSNDTSPESFVNKARTSVNGWIENKELEKLNQKIKLITGLNVGYEYSDEMLQVVEYVFGRYYTPHTDALGASDEDEEVFPFTNEEEAGDRVATLLFYLNDVPYGGSTPFCNVGTFAAPKKGSAVLWYNFYRNGTIRDTDTWHASCPVLYGHKIVANKWIRYNEQFNAFKCSLNQFE